MPEENAADSALKGWLNTLGIASLCQWDLLVFLHRHDTTLVGADYLAQLLGYATEPVVSALDALESLQLVVRSRVSQGARLYQFTPPCVPPFEEAFQKLLALIDHRAGRLRVARELRSGDEEGPGASGVALGEWRVAKRNNRPSFLATHQSQLATRRRATWRKAI